MAKRKATATTKRTRGADTKPRKKRTDSPCPPVNNSGNRKGEKCPLPKGAVAAIRSLRYRVPDTTPAPLAEIADEALDTVVKVMRGKVPYHEMTPRLKAAQIGGESTGCLLDSLHDLRVVVDCNLLDLLS